MKNVKLWFVFSWRELDSLSGVSENQEGPHALSLNYNNTQNQPNGEGLDNEEEEVCIPLLLTCCLFVCLFWIFFTCFLMKTLLDHSKWLLHTYLQCLHRWRISLTLCFWAAMQCVRAERGVGGGVGLADVAGAGENHFCEREAYAMLKWCLCQNNVFQQGSLAMKYIYIYI